MSDVEGPCVAHEFHSPRPQGFDEHHVWPKYMGGPEHGELVFLCQTGHANVHALLDAYEKYGETPPWPVRRSFGPGERRLAEEGWRRKREGESG